MMSTHPCRRLFLVVSESAEIKGSILSVPRRRLRGHRRPGAQRPVPGCQAWPPREECVTPAKLDPAQCRHQRDIADVRGALLNIAPSLLSALAWPDVFA